MLSIILVNYNNTYHTINCLKSLQNQKFREFEIIIVENNSNDLNKTKLILFFQYNQLSKSFLEKIKIIHSNKNLGFTGGSNLGIKNSIGDLILLLNCDTFHEPDFLGIIYKFFKNNKNIHIAQPKICYYSHKDIIWQNGGEINKFSFNLFKPIHYMKKEINVPKTPFKIDYAIGCALFIRRDILKKIGLLDNVYFCYCEESDLCYRAKLKGYNNIYCIPIAKIYHNRNHGFTDAFKKYYFRNRIIFCIKNFSILLIIWQLFMQFIQLLIFTIDFKNKKFDYKFFTNSIKGTIKGIRLGIQKRINY